MVTTRPQKPGKPADGKVASALVREARSWIGVPYVYGGKTKEGADCSGFLMQVYKNGAGIDIPRSTADQWAFCAPVDRDKTAVGDILFFTSKNSGDKVAHVGMYVGDGRMIHASSSRGVVEDDLSAKYYTTHFLSTGRPPMLAQATGVKVSSKTAPAAPRPTDLASAPGKSASAAPRPVVAAGTPDNIPTSATTMNGITGKSANNAAAAGTGTEAGNATGTTVTPPPVPTITLEELLAFSGNILGTDTIPVARAAADNTVAAATPAELPENPQLSEHSETSENSGNSGSTGTPATPANPATPATPAKSGNNAAATTQNQAALQVKSAFSKTSR